ncbi:unnamed protein product [Parascedosporium putredinis]|uniref:MaoC-like domain-containing protein n=1 Tax=Parascedosporium putredinis TaxID=1442378 RepID=A0A9P1H6D6_9PEZI|nr:unnamed protein product [Parascedosporium putredinis]CAI7998622.1 unnamed protein product [Parascedosporium putredinis]
MAPGCEVTWLKRDALLFANSIGCTLDELHFLYELHPDFAVFPTYPIILPFKGATQEVIDFIAAQKATPIPGVPKFDPSRGVDGQRRMTFLKPLPISSEGRRFEVRTKVLGVYDKGKPGTVVETQSDLIDTESGETYTRVVGSGFYDKKPDAVLEHQTSAESALLYRLNGDYNPSTPIPTCHELLKAFGGSNPANIKEYQARFASPVRPGDKLITRAWRTGTKDGEWEEVRFEVQVDGGKVCLSNGRAFIKVVDSAASAKL